MVATSKTLGLENLETRLNLSTSNFFAPAAPLGSSVIRDQFVQTGRLRLLSLTGQSATPIQESFTAAPTGPTSSSLTGSLAAPSNIQATLTSLGVRVTWIDRAANEQGYQVLRCTDGVNFTSIATPGRKSMGVMDTTVQPDTTYYYKVQAYNRTDVSSDIAPVSITTPLAPPAQPQVAAPNAPGTPTLTTTADSVTVTWADQSDNELGFQLYRSTDGADFTSVADLGMNATTWTDLTVSAGTQYWYKVSAWNAGGESLSATANATVPAASVPVPPPPPPAPLPAAPAAATNLAATTTTSSVALTWTDQATSELGVKVYRSTDGTNFTVVADLAPDAANWTDTTVSSSATYWYQVGGYNAGGETDTAAITATTQTPAPAAPTNLTVASTTINSVSLAWTDNATNETGLKVYRSTNGTTFTLVATLGANATTWTDTFVNSSTTYWYKVGDYNAAGETTTAPITATTPAAPLSGGVISATKNLTSLSELLITGTSGNDSIYVSQADGILSITANGQTTTYNATFGDLKIYGASGNDSITVDSSVTISALIYGGDGNDTIRALGSAKMTVVTIGNGTNTITGNGLNTAYWVNPTDTVNASPAEIALGGLNRVSNFYQPFTANSAAPNYIPRNLYGQNLTDPTDSGVTYRLQNASFWGAGPTKDDINQGSIADCYYLAGLSAMAYTMPQKLMNMGVDLGDGTYAVRYVRNGATSYVRVDGDLYGSGGTRPGANGNQWAPLFEKAYAFFRSTANTYASLNYGSASAALRDAGLSATAISAGGLAQSSLQTLINNQLAAGKPIIANTNSSIAPGVSLVGSHSYTVIGAYLDSSSGQLMIQLRNPWGVDGIGNDSNPNDGLVTITYSQLTSNISSLSYMT